MFSKVSIGLTATTIVSQWTWSATLLQSSTVASKYGISGPYWYAGGATIQICGHISQTPESRPEDDADAATSIVVSSASR